MPRTRAYFMQIRNNVQKRRLAGWGARIRTWECWIKKTTSALVKSTTDPVDVTLQTTSEFESKLRTRGFFSEGVFLFFWKSGCKIQKQRGLNTLDGVLRSTPSLGVDPVARIGPGYAPKPAWRKGAKTARFFSKVRAVTTRQGQFLWTNQTSS